jgi:hypothetical protein
MKNRGASADETLALFYAYNKRLINIYTYML